MDQLSCRKEQSTDSFRCITAHIQYAQYSTEYSVLIGILTILQINRHRWNGQMAQFIGARVVNIGPRVRIRPNDLFTGGLPSIPHQSHQINIDTHQ